MALVRSSAGGIIANHENAISRPVQEPWRFSSRAQGANGFERKRPPTDRNRPRTLLSHSLEERRAPMTTSLRAVFFYPQRVLDQASAQRGARNAQEGRRVCLIAVRPSHCFSHKTSTDISEIQALPGGEVWAPLAFHGPRSGEGTFLQSHDHSAIDRFPWRTKEHQSPHSMT